MYGWLLKNTLILTKLSSYGMMTFDTAYEYSIAGIYSSYAYGNSGILFD